jgi:hypothetical protein
MRTILYRPFILAFTWVVHNILCDCVVRLWNTQLAVKQRGRIQIAVLHHSSGHDIVRALAGNGFHLHTVYFGPVQHKSVIC